MKLQYLALLVLFLACNTPKKEKVKSTENTAAAKAQVGLLDDKATAETKNLYTNLWRQRDAGVMVGHHESLLYGRNWWNEPLRSDIKEVCGDYPAVCSLDFSKIEYKSEKGINGPTFDDMRRVTQEAYRRGEVITYCWHADNPLTGGDSWDNSNNTVVKEILTKGSETHTKYKTWLDNLAAFATTLTNDQGRFIPVIFRPFHEHTQAWNWWGKKCATEEEFIGLWRFTVDYLKNEKGIHHFIYAISPQMDFVQPKEDILFRWPGDNYVDFLGMDCYHGTNTEAFRNNLKHMAEISAEKKKPFGITETGVEGVRKNGEPYADYWQKEMLEPLAGSKASLVIFWRNAYDPQSKDKHFFGPYEGHASAENFKKFHASPTTLFSKDLPAMYADSPVGK